MSTNTRTSTSRATTNSEPVSGLPELMRDPKPGDRPAQNRTQRKTRSIPLSQPSQPRQAGGQGTLGDFFRVMQNWFEETEQL